MKPYESSTTRFANATARLLARHTSRRGFLVRSAVVGSALTVAPLRYILRPVGALAACTTCSGGSCPPGCESGGSCVCDKCCESTTTTYCCTLTGTNDCPSGSAPCGSWYCSNGYVYIDCCDCTCFDSNCHCANGVCTDRRTCCFPWEWGNCAHPTCGGRDSKIKCRVTRFDADWLSCPGFGTCSAAIFSNDPDDCETPADCAANPPHCH